jgi:hypothetical protein
MAIIEEVLGGEMLAGAGLGAGAALLLPTLLRRLARPAAKALIRGSIMLYRNAAEILDEASIDTPARSTQERSVPQRSAAAPRLQALQHAAGDKPAVAPKVRATRKTPQRRRKKT